MTKLGSRKLHICPKVTKMGSIIGHRIDYNGTYLAKINPPSPPGGGRGSFLLLLSGSANPEVLIHDTKRILKVYIAENRSD